MALSLTCVCGLVFPTHVGVNRMALLTCVCGARFELEDTLAGQTVTCPECQHAFQAPVAGEGTGGARRTNLLALLSAVLALVGAFTPLIGQAAAIVLGSLALVRIKRNREREAGAGLALFGIVGGVVFGGLMVFALMTGELFGIAGWWRQRQLGDKVDASGPLEISNKMEGFSLTRPSRKWAVVANKDLDDPYIKALARPTCDLMLVSLNRPIVLDVQSENTRNFRSLDEWEANLLDEWRPNLRRWQGLIKDNLYQPQLDEATLRRRPLDPLNGEGRELEMDVTVHGQRWHVLIRLYKPTQGKLYIVRAYAERQRNFKAGREEIASMLGSFKMFPGGR